MPSSLVSAALPVVLALVMFGLGLGLTIADFARVVSAPRAVAVTLVCQVVLLPAVCFGLVLATRLPPLPAVGMMLLAAAPGGPMSSVFSHLAGGDVALNLTVTGVNSALSLVTMPLVTVVALGWFVPGASALAVAPDKIVQVFAVMVIPVAVGMVTRRRVPDRAVRWQRPVRIASLVAVTLAVLGSIGGQVDRFLHGLVQLGPVVLAFCVASLGLGYAVPRLLRIGHRQAVAAGLEIGIHNPVVAITVAVSVLGDPLMAAAPAMYGVLMFLPAGVFAWLVSRRRDTGTGHLVPVPTPG